MNGKSFTNQLWAGCQLVYKLANNKLGNNFGKSKGWKALYLSRFEDLKNVIVLSGYNVEYLFGFSPITTLTYPSFNALASEKELTKEEIDYFMNHPLYKTRVTMWMISCAFCFFKENKHSDIAGSIINAYQYNAWSTLDCKRLFDILLGDKYNISLPSIDDIKAHRKILRKIAAADKEHSILGIDKLLEDSVIETKQLREKIKNKQMPLIFAHEKREEATLAQMCIWAYRQTDKKDEELVSCLRDCIADLLGWTDVLMTPLSAINDEKEFRESSRKLNVINQATFHSLKNWKTPSSKDSFTSYIWKIANAFGKLQRDNSSIEAELLPNAAEADLVQDALVNIAQDKSKTDISQDTLEELIGDRDKFKPSSDKVATASSYVDYGLELDGFRDERADYPLTVEQAARQIIKQGGIAYEPKNVIRWIYLQLEKGKIQHSGISVENVSNEGVVSRRNYYLLNEEEFSKAKELWITVKTRPVLVMERSRKTGKTKRAVQKWIKTRLDKGAKMEEIIKELKSLIGD